MSDGQGSRTIAAVERELAQQIAEEQAHDEAKRQQENIGADEGRETSQQIAQDYRVPNERPVISTEGDEATVDPQPITIVRSRPMRTRRPVSNRPHIRSRGM